MPTHHHQPKLSGFDVRPATPSDLDGIVTLLNASSMDTLGTRITAGHWQQRQWQESQMPLASNTRVVVNGQGFIAGYVQLVNDSPHVVNELSGAVHPDFRRRGIGSFLLDWAEARAHQLISRASPDTAVLIHSSLFDSNRPGLDLIRSRGYATVRRFIHLRIEMAAAPPEPEWPEGVSVRPIQTDDWPAVVSALEIAFQDHWGQIKSPPSEAAPESPALPLDAPEEKEQSSPNGNENYDSDYFNTPGLCFAAFAGDTVVGSCLCNARSIEFADTGRLGSLSVIRPWRRKGIGLALTRHALAEFYRRGTRVVVTDTDSQSFTGANFLYPQAGMSVFRNELLFEKKIRSGRDLLKREIA
jgi:mycothiol synthase